MDLLIGLLFGKKNRIESKDEIILRVAILVVCSLFLLCHAFFLVFYRVAGAWILSSINIFSVAFYGALLFINQKKVYPISALVISLELSVYSILTVYLVGWDAGAQWYITIMTVPYYLMYQIPDFIRKLSVTIFSLAMVACYAVKRTSAPVYQSEALDAVSAITVFLAITGPILIIIVLHLSNTLTERYYRDTIDSLTEKANRDALTGLWNRRFAEQFLQALFADPRQKNRAFLAIMDIDLFKNVNDTYGHDVGDQVLVRLSQEAHRHFRKTDAIARWGGEEFLIIITDTDENGARKAFNDFLAKVRALEVLALGERLRISVTIGYASCAKCYNYAECIVQSDEALYFGKRHGRDQTVYLKAIADKVSGA